MSRRLAREAAMCLLFEYAVIGEVNQETLEIMKDVFETDKLKDQNRTYIGQVMEQIVVHQEEIDDKIEQYSHDWKINRLSKVDLSILRLAILEIFYFDDIPIRVSVNEAVELAKKYSSEKSPKFINGLLGALLKEIPEV